jgi:hypothetical protein
MNNKAQLQIHNIIIHGDRHNNITRHNYKYITSSYMEIDIITKHTHIDI